MALDAKLELALKAHLETSDVINAGYTVQTWGTDEDSQLDRITCRVQGGSEEPLESGNYFCQVHLIIDTNATRSVEGSKIAKHRACVDAVKDLIQDETLCATISTYQGNFTAFDPAHNFSFEGVSQVGDCLSSTITFTIYCCEADIMN